MNKLGIVVLNYKSFNDTIECVNTLLKQEYDGLEIIIVDNNSENESVVELSKHFKEVNNITIIANEENLGFARGNNIGINYARQKLKCDFVFVLNSDTIINDKMFCKTLIKGYYKGVGVINPICCNIDGTLQIPYGKYKNSLVIETIIILAYIVWSFIRNILGLNVSITKNLKVNLEDGSLEQYKYVIQGPAYVLTPDFFENYKILFPRTFLYCEELMLAWYVHKANLKTIVVSNAKLIHKECGSTQNLKNSNKKLLLQLKSLIKGIPMYFMSQIKIYSKYSDNI